MHPVLSCIVVILSMTGLMFFAWQTIEYFQKRAERRSEINYVLQYFQPTRDMIYDLDREDFRKQIERLQEKVAQLQSQGDGRQYKGHVPANDLTAVYERMFKGTQVSTGWQPSVLERLSDLESGSKTIHLSLAERIDALESKGKGTKERP